MPAVITIVIILVLLVLLGVSTQMIANISAFIIVYLCMAMCIAMVIFFVIFMAKLVLCKKAVGVYTGAEEIQKGRMKYKRAVYEINGEKHFNVFPLDIKLFYKPGRECELYVDKKGGGYDINARITIIAGLMLSIASTMLMVMVIDFINITAA